MGFLSDLKILYHLALKPVRGKSHAERMENFYGGQAEGYDDFRRRLLNGREAMLSSVPWPENGVWLDMGGGTGFNIAQVPDQIPKLKKVYSSTSLHRYWMSHAAGSKLRAGTIVKLLRETRLDTRHLRDKLTSSRFLTH